MGLMNTAITLVGVLLIMVGLRDMFHQLLHPPSHGSLSRGVFTVVWRMSRVIKHRLGTAVGPGAMVLVIALWVQPAVAAIALEQLTRDTSQSCIDFNQYGETYYFREQHADLSLARYLPYTLEIRAAAGASTSPDVQLSGERFGFALQKLSEKLSHEFLSGNTPQEVFAAYAADHRAHQR
ncbi:hypothetical protein [Nesterenkonia massiliensis]|uniref:hypothetical protein n=1 Tax=Nesterenkonia massiliensis TaxID=1232429 RepID=UPI001F16B30C|nr:hypothetical protein [Nesterenkonia massiliensis]